MRILALIAALTFVPVAAASAQPLKYPPPVLSRGVMMANLCKAKGGKVVNGDRPFIYHTFDLTGDGRPDWVLDSAGFACAGRPNLFRSPAGATLEVFAADAKGGAARAFFGTAYTFRIVKGAPARLYVTQTGAACGGAGRTCESPLVWNAANGKLTPGALGAVDPGGQAGGGPAAGSAGGFSGPPFTISAADEAAAFRAAGFKQTRRGWQSCTDEDGATSLSYAPGAVLEKPDLNGDGRPEVWLVESGAICYGMTGQRHIILAKTGAGLWKVILDEVTAPTKLTTRTNGWLDIQDGGPGMGPWGKWRFNGSQYVMRR